MPGEFGNDALDILGLCSREEEHEHSIDFIEYDVRKKFRGAQPARRLGGVGVPQFDEQHGGGLRKIHAEAFCPLAQMPRVMLPR